MTANQKKGFRYMHDLMSLWAVVLVMLLSAAICFADCPALPAPTGNTVTVDTVTEIWNAVNTAVSGDTILIADGTYNLGATGRYIWVDVENVAIRSQSGNKDAVIFDDNYQGTEVITITASNVTIADLTIKRARTHAIHVASSSSADTLNTLIYNVKIIDPGQQAIKINPADGSSYFADYGEVACCTMELTEAGRVEVYNYNGSCYTGGVDGHQAKGWVVRDCTIEGFWCALGLSEHGVHFWTGSRDTIVERNTFINNARAVGFGMRENGTGRTYTDNPCPDATGYVGHFGGIVRNNFILADDSSLFSSEYGADTGIALWQSCSSHVYHNSLAFTSAPYSAVEYRFGNTQAEIKNNLTTHNILQRDEASATLDANLQNQALTIFDDPVGRDLHLASTALAAIDNGVALPAGACNEDFDEELRPNNARDIGADEIDPLPPGTTYSLTVTRSGDGGGTVTSSPAGIDCGSDCSQDYAVYSSVTLTAVADGNSRFLSWSGGGCSGNGSCTITMDQDHSISAQFSVRLPDEFPWHMFLPAITGSIENQKQ
ncbi:MAG: hypothetical protein D3926_22740 [Desulfobacteraceae bacterium]|nr:MAG: hypothetical protein D3926_22740 [Desulfobacteraceae bacterium]